MVTTALSEPSHRGNAFSNAAHLLYCQYDGGTCQQAGQLDVHLKMASQVVRPRVFCKHTPCTAPCMHIERALWGPASSYFLFLATVADALFQQNQHDTQNSHLNRTHLNHTHTLERWLQTYIRSSRERFKHSWSLSGLLSNWMNQARHGRNMAGRGRNQNSVGRLLHSCWWGFRSIHSFLFFYCSYLQCKTLSGYCCLTMPARNLHFN